MLTMNRVGTAAAAVRSSQARPGFAGTGVALPVV